MTWFDNFTYKEWVTFSIGLSMSLIAIWGFVYGMTPNQRAVRKMRRLDKFTNKEIK